jgi:hypothetical protein
MTMTDTTANFNEWYRADLFLAESDELAALKRAYEAGAASQAEALTALTTKVLRAPSDPWHDNRGYAPTNGGLASDMTLRDHFAGQALEGVAFSSMHPDRFAFRLIPTEMARWSYNMADAMLEARKTTGEGEV